MQTLSESIRERMQINEIAPLVGLGLRLAAPSLIGAAIKGPRKAYELGQSLGSKITGESFSGFAHTRALEIFESLQHLMENPLIMAAIRQGAKTAGTWVGRKTLKLGGAVGTNLAIMGGTAGVLGAADRWKNRNTPTT